MNLKLWSTCNDLDTVAMNQKATQDAFAYILDGLDRAACEASRGGQEASTAFLSQYKNFSRMLFMLMGVMQEQGKALQALIMEAFTLVEEEKEAAV